MQHIFEGQPCVLFTRTSSFIWLCCFHCVTVPHFVYPSANGWALVFPLFTMMNNVVNICKHVFVWTYVFIFLGQIPRSGIAGSHGKFLFTFLRNCQTVFQSGCTISWVPVPSYPHQHLVLSVLSVMAILVGVCWYLLVIWMYIIILGSDVEHLCIHISSICVSSLMNISSSLLPDFNQVVILMSSKSFILDTHL